VLRYEGVEDAKRASRTDASELPHPAIHPSEHRRRLGLAESVDHQHGGVVDAGRRDPCERVRDMVPDGHDLDARHKSGEAASEVSDLESRLVNRLVGRVVH
jgi:hypothetical protein